jgi:crossover junction endodeoxyribonuclease RuvC
VKGSVLGIDPGTATTGYGLVAEDAQGQAKLLRCGVFRTPAGAPMPERLQTIFEEVSRLIQEAAPAALAIEELFFSRNVTTALAVGQARGVVLLAAAQAGLPVTEYKPNQVKQALVGYGGASKQQIQEMLKIMLGLSEVPRPDDAADAVAIAVCHLHSARLLGLLASS